MKLATLQAAQAQAFCDRAAEALRGARSFETAASLFARDVVREFESVVLARVFGTVDFDALPPAERRFAATAVPDVALFPRTEVLTLFGSAGREPAWNERRRSEGHLAMPLLTRSGIEEAPMLSRLLHDLHFSLKSETPQEARVATRAFADANAICYIPDAETTVDVLGRRVIPATEFVRDYGVRTVIGVGGSYVVARMFLAVMLFTAETIPWEAAAHVKQLSSSFKMATTGVVRRGELFDATSL